MLGRAKTEASHPERLTASDESRSLDVVVGMKSYIASLAQGWLSCDVPYGGRYVGALGNALKTSRHANGVGIWVQHHLRQCAPRSDRECVYRVVHYADALLFALSLTS